MLRVRFEKNRTTFSWGKKRVSAVFFLSDFDGFQFYRVLNTVNCNIIFLKDVTHFFLLKVLMFEFEFLDQLFKRYGGHHIMSRV